MNRQWLASILIVSLPLTALPVAYAGGQAPATQKPDKPAPPSPKADAAKPGASQAVRTIDIVGTEDMKYSVVTIDAKPGEQIRVRISSKGAMPKIAMAHNFVLLTQKADVPKFINAAAMARATDFIPLEMKDQIIASTGLAGAGETVEVTFKAPKAPGAYNYICSFPGHFQAGMKGTLTVK
jgi:azurin